MCLWCLRSRILGSSGWWRMASRWIQKILKLCKTGLHLKNLKSLRGFLGLTGYYHKFVKNYGKIATPLTASPQKDNSFTWNPTAAQAFQTLKMAMCTTLVLWPFLISQRPCVLKCDALGKGIGVVLMQEGRPLAFTSKKLSEIGIWANPYMKRKMLAILHAIDLCGALISWGNVSKLRQTIKASSTFLE